MSALASAGPACLVAALHYSHDRAALPTTTKHSNNPPPHPSHMPDGTLPMPASGKGSSAMKSAAPQEKTPDPE